jgi:RNA polymerase-binding transcription factor DksA
MKMIDDSSGTRIPRRWAKYRQKLLALREHFLASRSGLVRDAERPTEVGTHDFADEANDEVRHDIAASMLFANEDILQEIDAALRRMENGTYGVCEMTQDPIPPARLAAIPWTRFTAMAEAELERRSEACGLRIPGKNPAQSPRMRKRWR